MHRTFRYSQSNLLLSDPTWGAVPPFRHRDQNRDPASPPFTHANLGVNILDSPSADPQRSLSLLPIRLGEQLRAMVENDPLQTQPALLVDSSTVLAMFAPQQLHNVLDQGAFGLSVASPVAEAFSGEMAQQPTGVILALLDKRYEDFHLP